MICWFWSGFMLNSRPAQVVHRSAMDSKGLWLPLTLQPAPGEVLTSRVPHELCVNVQQADLGSHLGVYMGLYQLARSNI